MDKELFEYVSERADILEASASSKAETVEAAKAWKAVTAEGDDAAIEAATVELVDFLEGRPTTIDEVIALADGIGKELFGEEAAAALLEKSQQRKADGAKFCDCPSCTAASEILAKFGRVEL